MISRIKPRQENHKDIFESLEILTQLHKDHLVVVEKRNSPIDKMLVNFIKNPDKGFSLKFEDIFIQNLEDEVTHFNIIGQNYSLHIEKLFITSTAFIVKENIARKTISGSIDNFSTQDFSEKDNYYFRLFIPVKTKVSFHYHINHFHYETKKYTSSECLRISYEKLEVDLYLYQDKEKGMSYVVLDSLAKLSFDQFSEYCFSTLVGFGYITGTLPQNEGYFFAYDKLDLKEPKHICYTEFRDSLNSAYSPIYGNAYGYIREKKLAKTIYPTLRTLSLQEFSKLCQWVYKSDDFSSILLLILEASTSSLLVMPSGFSVALEGLTNLIIKQNKDKIMPIQDSRIASKIRDELNMVITNYSLSISLEGQEIIRRKISNINQPTNKVKLSKPFEILNFLLTTEDIKAIEHRNDFLHGRINLIPDDNAGDCNREIYYISLRLYTLLAVLILKSVGYDNKIVNYPKIHETVYKKKLNESHFRQI